MAFEDEKQAIEAIYTGLNKACRSGSFDLHEAAELYGNISKIGAFLSQGVHGVLAQLVQPPAEEGAAEPSGDPVPGTDDKVAKSR